jgi:hypothetical protein
MDGCERVGASLLRFSSAVNQPPKASSMSASAKNNLISQEPVVP